MNDWQDDELMAFADGELSARRRQALAEAMAGDATLRARVETFQAQRQRVAKAFAAVLDEPVPDRLSALLAPPPAAAPRLAAVVALDAIRQRRGGLGWAAWGGMAASLAIGLVSGALWAHRGGDVPLMAEQGGRLLARGALAQALDTQLASDTPAGARVALQLSFVAQAGGYCRTFVAGGTAGLACRSPAGWQVQAAEQVDASQAAGLRQAASTLPPSVLAAVDRYIAGNALDATQERSARDRAWQR
ncbi:hypothetical protein LRH25_16395 [Ideonella azotifigens]|uniref:Anti-sigma factor n=1 Tax=Ideonella azotifigens TaxID=513160 RepID=A0ABN1JJV0_9BURK|nr:hypothetical protein [Ideonella azotifigens]MCD2341922.1 hypothetical protein [Ideonella azotifigens]